MPMPMSWTQHCTRSGHNCLEMGTLQYESIQLNDIHAIIVYNLIKITLKCIIWSYVHFFLWKFVSDVKRARFQMDVWMLLGAFDQMCLNSLF